LRKFSGLEGNAFEIISLLLLKLGLKGVDNGKETSCRIDYPYFCRDAGG
jgi:hydroxyethylthiazole kinase-like sugar kinase family protein